MKKDVSVKHPVGIKAQWKSIMRMMSFMAPVKFHVAVTGALVVAGVVAEVFAVRLLKPAIDVVQQLSTEHEVAPASVWEWLCAPEGSGAALRWALIWLMVAKIVLSVLAYFREIARSWQGMSMVYFMREAVYDRLQRVGSAFHDTYSTGQLITSRKGM